MAFRSAAAEAADPRAAAAHERAMAFMAHVSLRTGGTPPSSTGPSAPPGADPAAATAVCAAELGAVAGAAGREGAGAGAAPLLLCSRRHVPASLLESTTPVQL
jgi:hypothetical protein